MEHVLMKGSEESMPLEALNEEDCIQAGILDESALRKAFDEPTPKKFPNEPESSQVSGEPVSKDVSNKPCPEKDCATDATKKVLMDHACSKCSRSFNRVCHLYRHMRTHEVERPYKCTFENCDKAYNRNENLKRHLYSHTPEQKNYHCDRIDCAKTFSTQQRLNRHIALHELPKPYKCDICDQSFAKKKNRRVHVTKEHGVGPLHKCPVEGCTASFPFLSQLQRHDVDVHIEKSYICTDEKCSHLPPFTKFTKLQTHLRREHYSIAPYKCDACGKEFPKRKGLAGHMKIHTAPTIDRLVFCCTVEDCDASYTTSSNLGTHMRSKHTERDAFICDTCGKTFSLRTSLRDHLLYVHSPHDRTVDGKKSSRASTTSKRGGDQSDHEAEPKAKRPRHET